MTLFDLPKAYWQGLEQEFADQLNKLEDMRRDFPNVREQIFAAIDQLRSQPENRELPWRTSPVPFGMQVFRSYSQKGRTREQLETNRSVFDQIGQQWQTLKLDTDWLKSIHVDLAFRTGGVNGDWRKHELDSATDEQKSFGFLAHGTVPPDQVNECMNRMISSFHQRWNESSIARQLLISIFRVELFRIHPFEDGNGRVSRAAAVLLLYQSGHQVCDLLNLEDELYRQCAGEHAAVIKSLMDWDGDEETYDCRPYIRFWLEMLFNSYQELSRKRDRLHSISST